MALTEIVVLVSVLRRQGVLCAVTVASVVLSLGACSDGKSSGVTEEGLLPSGAPLGEDFVVPEGTRLIGSRFPSPYQDGAWQAVLLIDGEPLDVVDDLARQAEAGGLVGGHDSNCRVHVETVLECDFFAASAESDWGYQFLVRWGREEGATYRHVLVSGTPLVVEQEDLAELPPVRPANRVELPREPEPLAEWEVPEVGDPIAVVPDWFGEDLPVVEPETRVVAPDGPTGCLTGGYNVVLRVDGDPDEVIDGYREQFEDLSFEADVVDGTFEGRQFFAARAGTGGGGNLDAVALVGEPTLLLISRCND